MSYANPRPARLIKMVTGKLVGQGITKQHPVGTKVSVQRNPTDPAKFILWFSKQEVAQVPSGELMDTIRYTDGKPEGFNF